MKSKWSVVERWCGLTVGVRGTNWSGCSDPYSGRLKGYDALSSGRVFAPPSMQLGTKKAFPRCLLLWKSFGCPALQVPFEVCWGIIVNERFPLHYKIILRLPPSQHPKWLAVSVNPGLWILWGPLTARGDPALPECFLSSKKSMYQGRLCLTSINYTVPLCLTY